MPYRQVKQGEIIPWAEGVIVEGLYLGWRPIMVQGRESYLVDFQVDGKKTTRGCPVVLKSLLDQVGLGVKVKVICKGKAPTVNQQMAWQFDVFVDEPGAGNLPGTPNGDELPF